MAENLSETQEANMFRAVLTPYRSLSPVGFLVLMSAIAVISFIIGFVFLLAGAWPVLGFFGLDVLLIYVAFRLNYRSGRIYEIVELTRDQLTLKRFHPSGKQERFDFNPYWVRVLLKEWPDGRTMMRLVSHGRETVFGRFLTDDERRDFVDALKGALEGARVARP